MQFKLLELVIIESQLDVKIKDFSHVFYYFAQSKHELCLPRNDCNEVREHVRLEHDILL
ncbi:MAG: hypothetical protein RLZZ361_1034 [Cyanobacteriota bacterium]|jgi:hypothetical protein